MTVNGTDSTTAVRETGTTVLLVAIPTAVGGFFLILGVIIAVIMCIVSRRILRKRKQKAKNNAQCPEHGNIHTQQIILKQKVMNNKQPYTEHKVYTQQNLVKQKPRNTTPCSEHEAIHTQQNVLKPKGRIVAPCPVHDNIPIQLKLKQQAISSTVPEHDGNIPTQQNACYELSDDETVIDPPLYDEVDVQPTSSAYAVADADSHAGTSAGEEEDEYYVNDSLPSHPKFKKSSSLEDCEVAVEENNAYNATITHSQTPIYDEGIYY